ncbi:sensor histidine kinase [Streptomyces sp. NPDC047017]|uniref:sensor histidine kinase n=1 Tax=Streptomyces sp. NPDC047017 TaxID=3155024 RepID=UPI003411A586
MGADPLPPSTWLRRLPHGLVWLAAAGVLVGGPAQLREGGGLALPYVLLISFGQSGAVALALWRPVAAWWGSTAVMVVTAVALHDRLTAGYLRPWPWTSAGLIGHLLVLLLLALRVRARVAVEALAVSALVTYVLEGLWGAVNYQPTGIPAVLMSTVVVVLGAALRGRREARAALGRQTTLTAEERARRTLLEERSRIARELHDVVAHHMSVISIQAQVAPHLTENPSDELKENLAGIRQNALEALAELRRVLGVLRSPHPEDPYGLGEPGPGAAPRGPQPTLDRLGALVENTRAAGLTVALEIEDSRGRAQAYPPGVELSAYRIVQEALSNALRHAPGSTVRVEITHIPDGLCLSVINSRPQQPVPPSPGAGHGLLGMRERAAMLGGHVSAARTLHGGFNVTAFLPRDGTAPLTDPGPCVLPVVHTDPAGSPVFVLEPPHTPRTPPDTPRTPPDTPRTPHDTPRTPHDTPRTPHDTAGTPQDTTAPGPPPPTGEDRP